VLVCDLWREGGFDARTTKFSQDFNIDVIVERPNGDLNLIQAKQYEQGNPVGVQTVQRTAGLVVEFDAEEVYVVTSSSFTESAHRSASRMDHEITLIDGERLCELLTRSPLVPPL
jgi:restriction endonuclease Mrr